MPGAINPEQVMNLLKYIDAEMDETIKAEVFSHLGHECFYSNHRDQWIDSFAGDVERFLDVINVQQRSPYWESLVFSEDKTRLTLTGREVDQCACPFAACSAPALSLCNYCCKNFQQVIFSSLLGRPVEVTITAAYLLGDKRCSTLIEIK
jgi:predicted ArsR family transcriptional regulator